MNTNLLIENLKAIVVDPDGTGNPTVKIEEDNNIKMNINDDNGGGGKSINEKMIDSKRPLKPSRFIGI